MTASLLGASLWLAPTVDAEPRGLPSPVPSSVPGAGPGAVSDRTIESGESVGGYHHLGAASSEPWSGVQGRLQVRDPGVRPHTYDFVAVRFMVKQHPAVGEVAWLEAGWAENGWRAGGEQVVYTYDSTADRWTFYDDYPIRDGDQIWIHLRAETTGPADADGPARWTALLWWQGRWQQLTTVSLPSGSHADVEEFVEVYVDPVRGGALSVPRIRVDKVRLENAAGQLTPWRGDVATATADRADRYCLDWRWRYHTWFAGDC